MSDRFTISINESVKLIVRTALEEGVTDDGQIANILGQVEHETAFIYAKEINCASQAAKYGYEGGARYCGRGYIQITHLTNYRKFGRLLGQDFISNPDAVKEPAIAAKIAVIGMRDGLFRLGHKLSRYMNNGSNDFYNARRIVNGMVAAQAQSVKEKSEKWLSQVPSLKNGSDPNLEALPTNTSGANRMIPLLPRTTNNQNIFTGASIGVCSEQFPITYSIEEALTYVGCLSRQAGNAMGSNSSLSYSANGLKVVGGSHFDIADFNPDAPICDGCLGFPFQKEIRITSPFCQRRTARSGRVYYHSGTDYGALEGEPVLAVADGKVISPLIAGDGYEPGFVDIIHEELGNLLSRSAHIIPSVRPGDTVKQGDIIGKVGPYPQGGPHLHLELRKDKGAGGSAFSIEECKSKFLDPAIFCRRS